MKETPINVISSQVSREIKIGNSMIKSTNCDKLLGVKIDTKFTFDGHIKDMCRKTNCKLCVLGRVTLYMGLRKKKLLMNSFFAAQFNYCPLIWMFHGRNKNSKMTHLHERCLRLIYSDKSSRKTFVKGWISIYSSQKYSSYSTGVMVKDIERY